MAQKRVNATRMELLRLKRRAVLAKKGHKLLKDKLDGLIRQLLEVVREHRRLSNKIEQELILVFQKISVSSAQTSPEILAAAAALTTCTASVDISLKNFMGVKLPKYELKLEGDPINYSFAETPAELDQALSQFKETLANLVKLAELNKAILVIAQQIIEIKRRVNALEYVLIPELETAVSFIKMKLSEIERSTTVTLLKIKDLVRSR